LRDWSAENGVQQPFVPERAGNPYHLYYLLLPDAEQRNAFLQAMHDKGVMCVFHYLPLHLSQMGLRFGRKPARCPVTESVSERIVRLPFFTDMSEAEVDAVIAAVKSFRVPPRRRVIPAFSVHTSPRALQNA